MPATPTTTSPAELDDAMRESVGDIEKSVGPSSEPWLPRDEIRWLLSQDRTDEGSHEFHLIPIHRVPHRGIDPLGDLGPHPPQHLRGLVHPLARDVGIAIAAAEEDRRARERARIVPRGARRTDQP